MFRRRTKRRRTASYACCHLLPNRTLPLRPWESRQSLASMDLERPIRLSLTVSSWMEFRPCLLMSIFLPLLATTTVLTLLRALHGKGMWTAVVGHSSSVRRAENPGDLWLSCPSMAEWESRQRACGALPTISRACSCPAIERRALHGACGRLGAHLGACTFRLPPMAVLADRACMTIVWRCWRGRKQEVKHNGAGPPAQPEGSHQAHPCCAR